MLSVHRFTKPLILTLLFAMAAVCSVRGEDEAVFSGPQVGEKLASFEIVGVLHDENKEIDLVGKADGKPVAIVFVHGVTRPSIGLLRSVMTYAGKQKGLTAGVVFLTDDVTEMTERVKRMSRALPKNVHMGISPDKQEGPGAYGLNRNVTLTVLVGKGGKVTANFAIVQPSLQADAPKIGNAIAAALGVDPPKAQEIIAVAGMRAAADPELVRLVRPMLKKDATDEQVAEVKQAVEKLIQKRPRVRSAVAQQASGALRRGGDLTPAAKKVLNEWVKKYTRRPAPQAEQDPQLRSYLAPVIQKDATPEQVDAAAKKLEEYVAKKPQSAAQVGQICRRIIDAGVLARYGTERAQEHLKTWAKKYPADKKR
ncbi:MAG: hypothetical protein QGG36_31405 [Pirellulaceae bacterium]|jgi:hypothetical protein|nr:hypothetical protein [Pirellulaceae bacterium]MDP7020347.1 hypothetical protein [Pirellulaceae bacterium]